MADIAFLLLIFFLVTTTMETDSGLDRVLLPDDSRVIADIREKNIFLVSINKNNELLVEEELTELTELKDKAIAFLDNGGDGTCTYCKGAGDESLSDNPAKAIISLKSDREARYGTYITVQNELVGAYNDLRNREAQRLYGRDFTDMEAEYLNPGSDEDVREALKVMVKQIQDLFPQKLSEAETTSN